MKTALLVMVLGYVAFVLFWGVVLLVQGARI